MALVLNFNFRSILNLLLPLRVLLLLLVCVSSEDGAAILSTGQDVKVFVADQINQNDVSLRFFRLVSWCNVGICDGLVCRPCAHSTNENANTISSSLESIISPPCVTGFDNRKNLGYEMFWISIIQIIHS